MKSSISRRNFLKTASLATAAAAVTPAMVTLTSQTAQAAPAPGPGNTLWGRVVVNFNNTHAATTNGGTAGDQTILKKMVDDSITLLTGITDVGAAWKSIFPATLTAASKIAIKINLSNTAVPAHPFLLMGIVEGLQKMDFGGTLFPAANIRIYELAGNFTSAGVTAARFPGVTIATSAKTATNGARDLNYSQALADADFLINVPSIRGMSSAYAAPGLVTMGFKAHYGTYNANHTDAGYLRDINGTGPVYNKTVMTLISGIYAMNLGNGPTGTANNFNTYAQTMVPGTATQRCDTIVMGTDPVAAEFQAICIMRKNVGQTYTPDTMPDYLKISGGMTVAGKTTLYFGEIDDTKAGYDYREIINGAVTHPGLPVSTPDQLVARSASGRLMIFPVPTRSYLYIDCVLPKQGFNRTAQVEIYSTDGKLVRRFENVLVGTRSRVIWDRKDDAGKTVAAGEYLIKVKTGSTTLLKTAAVIE